MWAARYQPLRLPEFDDGSTSVRTALAALPVARHRDGGGLRTQIDTVLNDPAMRRTIGAVSTTRPHDAVVDVASAMARVFTKERLQADGPPPNQIVLLHTVTGAQAVASLLPLLDKQTGAVLCRSLVATSLAVAVAYSRTEAGRAHNYTKPRLNDLRSVAGAGREAHVSKGIAAAISISQHRRDRAFTDFAVHASLAMDPLVRERVPDAVERITATAAELQRH